MSGLARVIRGNAVVALENVALWHERDISHSSAERIILPDSCILLDYMLVKLRDLVDGLQVYPERMEQNLGLTKGLYFSQSILLALTRAGAERKTAYEAVQRAAMKTWKGDETFRRKRQARTGNHRVLSAQRSISFARSKRIFVTSTKLFARSASSRRLFVAQRLDWIERSGTISRIKSEPNSYRRTNNQAGDCPAPRKNEIDLERKRQEISADDAEQDSDNAAGFGNENGFRQKLSQNIAAPRADRFANSNLFRSLGHADQHDVHDPDAGREERDETDNKSTDADNARNRSESALERVIGINLKIILLIRL